MPLYLGALRILARRPLKRSDFHFDLPSELIGQEPLDRRSDSRLLFLPRFEGEAADRQFRELPDLLRAGDIRP